MIRGKRPSDETNGTFPKGGLACTAMNRIPDDQWTLVTARLRTRCPKLTPTDLSESRQRIDLLVAKIQNRHWIDRVTARRVVLDVLQQCGGVGA
jgi:hypothetical protein